MGWRYRNSIHLARGLRINLSKSGAKEILSQKDGAYKCRTAFNCTDACASLSVGRAPR